LLKNVIRFGKVANACWAADTHCAMMTEWTGC
jgi:hypothetical protein